jgi:hypothetical protein
MAKLADLVDDLTGSLNNAGGHAPGPRTQGDPYLQNLGAGAGPQGTTFAPSKPAGPVSPFPPSQLAMAPPMAAQTKMPPPMDAGASMQQAMAQQALESNIMRPPYSQPYGPAAYALQAGFQGAPVSAIQAPAWASADGCGVQGAPLRMSPAAQMQMMKDQRLAQLQMQQQAAAQQASAAKAGQQCLQQQKHSSKVRSSVTGEATGDKNYMWTVLIILIIILLLGLVGMAIGFGVTTVRNSHQLAILRSPVSV